MNNQNNQLFTRIFSLIVIIIFIMILIREIGIRL